MPNTEIVCSVERSVATITLHGPAKLNAVSAETIDRFAEALEYVDRDDGVRVVVVTGSGKAFCAGTDISEGFQLPTGGDPVTGEGVPSDVGAKVALRLFRMNKPVIGAINGAAVGFGASVILPMDIRICAIGARFGYVFTRRGIVAESCSSWFLPRVVGISVAQDWMITGRMVDSAEALRRGLVSDVVEPDRLMERANEIAHDIARHTAPVSVALTRRLLWQMLGASHPQIAHDFESRGIAATLALPDVGEAMAAFRDKRAPEFSGSVARNDLPGAWWPEKTSR